MDRHEIDRVYSDSSAAQERAMHQHGLPLADAPPAPKPLRAGRIKLVHDDKVAARRELLRHGFWPLGVGPADPETWADKKLKRRFCFRTEGATVRLVEVTR